VVAEEGADKTQIEAAIKKQRSFENAARRICFPEQLDRPPRN